MKDSNYDEWCMFEECIVFLNSIGIQITFNKIEAGSFLPGFLIKNGVIIIDRSAMQHPGDVLHEAGHIAVVPSKDRAGLTEASMIKRRDREAEEVMAIAWSYAVCMHLGLDPAFVFHEDGYRGGSAFITDECSKKDYLGLLMLQGIGLTADAYPDMIKWLRQ